MMGALLISSLIIFPALTSMRLCNVYKHVILVAMVISSVCFCLGMIISYRYGAPTGASIVVVNAISLVLANIVGGLRRHI